MIPTIAKRFLGASSLTLLGVALTGASQAQDPYQPRFRDRNDIQAISDRDQLRLMLSQLSDGGGPINPLAKYVKPQRSRDVDRISGKDNARGANAIKPTEDEEATRKPTLSDEAQRRLRSNTASTNADFKSSIKPLAPARLVISNAPASYFTTAYDDGFRPYLVSSYAPTVTFANVINPLPNVYTANYQADPQAVLPPSLPPGSVTGGISSNVSGAVMPAPPSYGAPAYSTQPYNNGGTVINPGIPSGTTYPGNVAVPQSMPAYGRSTSVINGEPFVSGQPCQFDASYMVSPTVYRQASADCGPARSGVYAPLGTASPFGYATPVMMPYPVANNNGGFRPLIGFGQGAYNAQVGRGIIGQPTAYVNGQPIRNFLRYIFP